MVYLPALCDGAGRLESGTGIHVLLSGTEHHVANIPTDEIQDLANGGLASSLGGLVNGLSVRQQR